jgi:hypothetical protein
VGIYPFNPNIILYDLTSPRATPSSENVTECREVDLSQTLLGGPQESTSILLNLDVFYTQIITDRDLATTKEGLH